MVLVTTTWPWWRSFTVSFKTFSASLAALGASLLPSKIYLYTSSRYHLLKVWVVLQAGRRCVCVRVVHRLLLTRVSFPVGRRPSQYIVHGVFFKRVSDIHNIYGSLDAAGRAASHEMRGARAYLQARIPGLRTALMAVIDFQGQRILASAVLPIGSDSLLYVARRGWPRACIHTLTSTADGFTPVVRRQVRKPGRWPHGCLQRRRRHGHGACRRQAGTQASRCANRGHRHGGWRGRGPHCRTVRH